MNTDSYRKAISFLSSENVVCVFLNQTRCWNTRPSSSTESTDISARNQNCVQFARQTACPTKAQTVRG